MYVRKDARKMGAQAIWRSQDVFPLGTPAGQPSASGGTGGETIPFGLRYLTDPDAGAVSDVDFGSVSFDEDAQISMVRGRAGLVPLFKHTSGQTSTTMNAQDRKTSDSDTDTEQDK
jgi:putative ATP-grasp target RiPP